MKMTLAFGRLFFLMLTLLFMTAFSCMAFGGINGSNVIYGTALGVTFALFLVGLELLFKKFHPRAFNTVTLGLFFGFLMGQVLLLLFGSLIEIAQPLVTPAVEQLIRVSLLLLGAYLGMVMTLRAADELSLSLPFVRFKYQSQRKRDLLLDLSILEDSRLIDLAASGLLDNHLVVPRFIIKELYQAMDKGDNEGIKAKSRRSLDVLKKLEALPHLDLRFNEMDYPEMRDSLQKLVRLARFLDANILSADTSKVQSASVEGVRMINIHALSHALKPLMQTGEALSIKVQRYGKEPRQGVGYLDDGTMVVINGGGNFIGETVRAHVLSVKHTASGRMIFCNALEEDEKQEQESYVNN